MRLEWSPRAVRELTQLRDYIAQDSPFYARQFTERLIIAVERLCDMPRSGRMVPEAGHRDSIRELIFRSYRVIYRILEAEELLQIITIVHGARDLPAVTPSPWEPSDTKKG